MHQQKMFHWTWLVDYFHCRIATSSTSLISCTVCHPFPSKNELTCFWSSSMHSPVPRMVLTSCIETILLFSSNGYWLAVYVLHTSVNMLFQSTLAFCCIVRDTADGTFWDKVGFWAGKRDRPRHYRAALILNWFASVHIRWNIGIGVHSSHSAQPHPV